MQLTELVDALTHIDTCLTKSELVAYYDQMIHGFQAVRENKKDEKDSDLNDLRTIVAEAHNRFEKEHRAIVDERIFEKVGSRGLVGQEARDRFENLLLEHLADPRGAAGAIQQLRQDTDALHKRTRALLHELAPMAEQPASASRAAQEGKASGRLVFDRDVAIETLKDLSEHIERWEAVSVAFSRLLHKGEEVRVDIGSIARRPFQLELIAGREVLQAIHQALQMLLEAMPKIVDLKTRAADTRGQHPELEKIAEEFDRAATGETEKAVKAVVDALGHRYSFKDAETRRLIEQAVKYIYDFSECGGRVEIESIDQDATLEKAPKRFVALDKAENGTQNRDASKKGTPDDPEAAVEDQEPVDATTGNAA